MTHGPSAIELEPKSRAAFFCSESSSVGELTAPRTLAMSTLNVASKANQATTLPALLVVHYAKECDQSVSIDVKIEDIDTLKSGEKASIELAQGSSSSTYGCKEVIDELMTTYRILQAKNEKTVSAITEKRTGLKIDFIVGQRMARAYFFLFSYRFQVRRGAHA